MKKTNIAELLKNCPQGMELDCTMYDNVTLREVSTEGDYPIKIITKNGFSTRLTKYGQNVDIEDAKCVIFPKGKTTWEGFFAPYKFKDGDIIYIKSIYDWVVIYKESNGDCLKKYVSMCIDMDIITHFTPYPGPVCCKSDIKEIRLATEEEKQKLLRTIKGNGYSWNAETKTLEELIEPKFKVGDKIRLKENHNYIYTITGIREEENKYDCGATFVLRFSEQDNWELVPDKFDITTLKPFESRVLVRDSNAEKWKTNFWGFYDIDHAMNYPYECCGTSFAQCIPYEGNEYLLSTTNDCDEYFKTWK